MDFPEYFTRQREDYARKSFENFSDDAKEYIKTILPSDIDNQFFFFVMDTFYVAKTLRESSKKKYIDNINQLKPISDIEKKLDKMLSKFNSFNDSFNALKGFMQTERIMVRVDMKLDDKIKEFRYLKLKDLISDIEAHIYGLYRHVAFLNHEKHHEDEIRFIYKSLAPYFPNISITASQSTFYYRLIKFYYSHILNEPKEPRRDIEFFLKCRNSTKKETALTVSEMIKKYM